jgi:ATPase subunit of ABC transporter with duplicated ATPase domains
VSVKYSREILGQRHFNHLDIEARERFEEALDAFAGAVLVVSHDRAFVRSFAERSVEL